MADAKGLQIAMPGAGFPNNSLSFNAHVLDASNDGVAFVFQSLNANPITGFSFRYSARTGTPPTYVATLEGVTASTGFPDGSDVGGGSPTAKTFTPPADATWDGTQQSIVFTNAYTPSRGQLLCVTIRHSSGTVDGSNNSSFVTDVSGLHAAALNCEYGAVRLTAGSWAKRSIQPCFGIHTASERYGYPFESLYDTDSASTVGHRQAMKFTIPAGWCDTFKVRGFRMVGAIAQTTSQKNPIAGLWSASALLQGVTLDSRIVSNAANSLRSRSFLFDEATLSTLSAGTTYYVGLEVADAVSGGVRINGLKLASSADLDAYPGGSDFHFATFDGSSWTDDQTVRPFVELILDDITEPAASGGGSGLVASLSGGVFQ